jgi:hypothetical protein
LEVKKECQYQPTITAQCLACVIELRKVSGQIKSTTKTIGNQTNERFQIFVPPNFSWPSN